jgi:hypothetical protein
VSGSGPSFVAYIDESGDEGFDFNNAGTSHWFVLSSVVVRAKHDPQLVKDIVDRVRTAHGNTGRKKLRFRKMRPPLRQSCVDIVSTHRIRTVTVLIYKPSLTPETFRKQHRLYFYATRFLSERISWLCRDHRIAGEGDGSCRLVFDERQGMSYANMEAYFRLLRQKRGSERTEIEWSVISTDLIESTHGARRVGLQVADFVAGSFFCAVDSVVGQGICDYARCLRPVVYHHNRKYKGYGVKQFPMNCQDVPATNFLSQWP